MTVELKSNQGAPTVTDGRAGTRNRREGQTGSRSTPGKGRLNPRTNLTSFFSANFAKQSHARNESAASFVRNKATAVRSVVRPQRASAGSRFGGGAARSSNDRGRVFFGGFRAQRALGDQDRPRHFPRHGPEGPLLDGRPARLLRRGQFSSPPGSIPCSTSFLRSVLRLMPRICAART